MTAGVRSLSLEETLLEPPALPPPPMRHALFVILIALAALLHVATIGSGDLYSQTEGQYAGAAREMVEAHHWLLPTNDGAPRLQKPPLLYWLIIISFKLFGVNAAAARTPGRAGRCRLDCPDLSHRGKAHGLLARFYRWSDLSESVRHIFARAHRHARTARQRTHRGRDFLRDRRLSAPA